MVLALLSLVSLAEMGQPALEVLAPSERLRCMIRQHRRTNQCTGTRAMRWQKPP